MTLLKDCLQALLRIKRKNSYFILLAFLFSCATVTQKVEIKPGEKVIRQKLKVKIYHDNKIDKLSVYTSINRQAQHAILDGIGTFNKHVFRLEVKNEIYNFTEYVNNTNEEGNLRDFKRLPINTYFLFKKLDINEKQPLIIENTEHNIRVSIIVVEQFFD